MRASAPLPQDRTPSNARDVGGTEGRHLPSTPHFSVVAFRRDAKGAIVPDAALEVPNGDIAWKRARAAASERGHVGAVALTSPDAVPPGESASSVLLASFGDVDLSAVIH